MRADVLSRRLVLLLVLLSIPTLVWAREVSVEDAVASLLSPATLILWLISTMCGVASLLDAIVRALRLAPERIVQQPYLQLASQVLGGWVGGLLMLVAGKANGINGFTVIAMVIVASFIGAKVVVWVGEKWFHIPSMKERRSPANRTEVQ